MIKIYETKRLILARAEKSRPQWFQNQEVCKYNSHGVMSNVDMTPLDPNTSISWDVWVKDQSDIPEVLIGKVSLMDVNWNSRKAEFGCIFGETEYWGCGYATEAVQMLFEHGFNKMGLHKIWLGTVVGNKGMVSVASKLGMRTEGDLIDDVFVNGEFMNVLRFGVIKEDWGNGF